MRSLNRAAFLPSRGLHLLETEVFSRLCRARDYLGENFDQRTPQSAAAREACFSPYHFNRLFTDVFGQTPHEFVTSRRIEKAKHLLLAGDHSITDICFEIGYESLGSFSSRFRSLTGLSPLAFRRQARRTFAGLGGLSWTLYYIPACFQPLALRECSCHLLPE
jgi:AraC-like DNA-binding protein